MVANMKVGKMDGFCVGEPWNTRAIADGIGFTAITTQEMWKDHPEKVCAFTEEFAEKNPEDGQGRAQGAAPGERVARQAGEPARAGADRVARPTYINCPPEIILGGCWATTTTATGAKKQDPNYMIFSERNCNYPQPKYAKWWLTQFRRWGMVEGAPDYAGVAKQVMRTGHLPRGDEGDRRTRTADATTDPETLFDGNVFDPQGPEKYATILRRSTASRGLTVMRHC